jgi:pimeloyl-ACP methyl ester carboxylesterase
VLSGELTWSGQLPLAQRWTLLIVDRAGYGRSRVTEGEDIEADAGLVADLIQDGAHLVGQSSGAVAALLAAARRPDAVLSLTLSEPPAFQVVPESADAQEMSAALETHFGRAGDDAEWLRGFVRIISGAEATLPHGLPPPVLAGVRAVRGIRRLPWRVELPIEEVAAAPFPKLVISGGHSPAFETVCDLLADRLGARRAQVIGAGHTTPHTGPPFNETLETFLRASTVQDG